MASQTVENKEFVLTSADVCAHKARLYGVPSTGLVTVTPADGLIYLGTAELSSGYSGSLTGDGTKKVLVDFGREVAVTYVPVASANPVNKCFQTVYPDATNKATTDNDLNVALGLCLEVNSTLGILVATNF